MHVKYSRFFIDSYSDLSKIMQIPTYLDFEIGLDESKKIKIVQVVQLKVYFFEG